MRNRALHDALRDFALESASLLTDELRDGAEIEFDVLDESGGRGPSLYRYRPRTAEFVAACWEDLRALPACARAGAALGAGASLWLRENGMDGERAEPALRAMLERLYEDATSFGFPEERFERLYAEVEQTLYRDAVRTRVAAPLRGLVVEPERVDLGAGLTLVRGNLAELPPEAAWAEDGSLPDAVCVLERDANPDDPLRAAEVAAAVERLVTALRLLRPGAVSSGSVAWRRSGEGRYSALALTGDAGGRGECWTLVEEDVDELRDLMQLIAEEPPAGAVAWALRRFELGCARPTTAEALSDYLLALRALLDASTDAGEASLALRVAALCAEEGRRRVVARRIELAAALERFAMQGGGYLDAELRAESAPELVAELEGHLRALLRDILCGYLDPDLKGVADDILLESREPFEISARDLRSDPPAPVAEVAAAELAVPVAEPPEADRERPPEWFDEPETLAERRREWFEDPEESFVEEADTQEVPALAVAPPVLDDETICVHRVERLPRAAAPEPEEAQQTLEGVTPSADWSFDDPEDFSAPI